MKKAKKLTLEQQAALKGRRKAGTQDRYRILPDGRLLMFTVNVRRGTIHAHHLDTDGALSDPLMQGRYASRRTGTRYHAKFVDGMDFYRQAEWRNLIFGNEFATLEDATAAAQLLREHGAPMVPRVAETCWGYAGRAGSLGMTTEMKSSAEHRVTLV